MNAAPRPVGVPAATGPMTPTARPAQHGACTGATGEPEDLDPHERVSVAHARLAELHAEIAGIHQELAQVELAVGAGSALMVTVPEVSKTRPLLTVNDLAEVFQVDAKTVRRWREEGRLPDPIQIGGVIRWEAAEIDRWLAERQEGNR